MGRVCHKLLAEKVVRADIFFHGSFLATGKGHGTDKALLAGIMGFSTEDERIRNALEIAVERGISYQFCCVNLGEAHPNTAVLYLTGSSGKKARIIGASVGGGNVMITNIDGYDVALTGQYPALIVVHRDCPGIIAKVTNVLARYEVNIAFMRVSRHSRGAEALMILETDDLLSDDVVEECRQVCDVEDAFSIPAV